MKLAVLAVTMLAVVGGCARSGQGERPASGITGQVLAGPQCPVERADRLCPDQPASGVTVVARAANGDVAGSDVSDADGTFVLAVGPGRYAVSAEGIVGIQSSKPQTVTVREGSLARVTVSVDTGIR